MPYNDDTDNYGAAADLGMNGAKTLSSVKAGAGVPDFTTRARSAVQGALNPVLDSLDKQVRGHYPGTPTDPEWEDRMKKAGRRGEAAKSPYIQPALLSGGRG